MEEQKEHKLVTELKQNSKHNKNDLTKLNKFININNIPEDFEIKSSNQNEITKYTKKMYPNSLSSQRTMYSTLRKITKDKTIEQYLKNQSSQIMKEIRSQQKKKEEPQDNSQPIQEHKLITELKPKLAILKEKSQDQYIKKMNKFIRKFNIPEDFEITYKNKDTLEKYVKEFYPGSLSSQRTMYSTLRKIAKGEEMDNWISLKSASTNKSIKKENKKNLTKCKVDYNDFMNLGDKEPTPEEDLKGYIIMTLLRMGITPRNDWGNTRFGENTGKGNWINLKNRTIIFNDYKSSAIYNKVVYQLTTPEYKKLSKINEFNKDYIFGKSLNSDNYSHKVSKYLRSVGLDMTPTDVRIIKQNKIMKHPYYTMSSIISKEQIHKHLFMNSPETGSLHYFKVCTNVGDQNDKTIGNLITRYLTQEDKKHLNLTKKNNRRHKK
jgi:hypothetical protein